MTTFTGNSSTLDDRATHGFDRLITATPAAPPTPHAPTRTPSARRGRRGLVASVVVVLMLVVIAGATLALLELPGQSAGAATPPSAISGSEIAESVQTQWVDAGSSGTAACADPAAQTPGTTVECTGVFDGAPIAFTATLGDTAAGGARFTITSWATV